MSFGKAQRGALNITKAMASVRNTVKFSRKNMFRVYKAVLNNRKNMFPL